MQRLNHNFISETMYNYSKNSLLYTSFIRAITLRQTFIVVALLKKTTRQSRSHFTVQPSFSQWKRTNRTSIPLILITLEPSEFGTNNFFILKGGDVYFDSRVIMVCSRYARHYIHYDTALKRKCLLKLKNNVWERKIKWKLIERAECHHRQKLLLKYFRLWVIYLNKSLRKKINIKFADSLFEEKLKLKGILALRLNVEHKWMFIRLYRKKMEWNLKVRAWHCWKHYTLKRLKIREIKLLANKIRQDKLLIRFVYIWSLRFKEKLSLKEINGKAVTEYETRLTRKCFNNWKRYKDRKICKRAIWVISNACYQHKVKKKFFHFWKCYNSHKKLYRNRIKIIDGFYQNYVLTIYLNHWFTIYEKLTKERETENFSLAADFSDKKLLTRILRSWHEFSERGKQNKEKSYIFYESYTEIYLNIFINLWTTRWQEKLKWNRLEDKSTDYRKCSLIELLLAKLLAKHEEITEERQQLSNASTYYNAIILHRAFKGWQGVMLRKIDKRLKMENATEFHIHKLKKMIFDKWKEFRVMRIKKKTAITYHQNLQLFRIMDKWKLYLEYRKALVNKALNLERIRNQKLMNHAFSIWKAHTDFLRMKMNVAIDFNRTSKMSKVFVNWKIYSQTKSVRKSIYTRNRNHINSITIKTVLFRCYEILTYKRNLKRRLELANQKKDERLVKSCFTKWNQFYGKMKILRRKIDFFPQLNCMIVFEQYLTVLEKLLEKRKLLKRQEELAVKAEEKILKRKYLNKWMSFIRWKRKKLAEYEVRDDNFESSTDNFGIPGKTFRRQPIIPDYLMSEFGFEQFQDSGSHESTFEVVKPVNKRLPIVDQEGMFVSFEV